VQLLLFGLGRELSMSKLRPVLRPAVLGGTLQIAALMAIGGAVGGVIGGGVQQGLFIGALLSMSSTSVVIKCLESTRSTGSAYGQLTIGTLILQDCSVGLMFALMPAFAHRGGAAARSAAAATAAAAKAAGGGPGGGAAALAAAVAAAEAADDQALARAAVALLVLRVLGKLALTLAAAWAAARTVLPLALRLLVRCGALGVTCQGPAPAQAAGRPP
jgi:Kef-type K+ transport system membrane component KefB